MTDQTYYRWRKEYGGLQMEQAKKLKELQKENGQLKRALAGKYGRFGYRRITALLKLAGWRVGKDRVQRI